jgi:hypothetical protein
MKPKQTAWLAAALAVVAVGSWSMSREATDGTSNENRPAAAPAAVDRKPGASRTAIHQDPEISKPGALVDDAGSLGRAPDRSVASGGAAPASLAALTPDASHVSPKRSMDRNGGPMGAAESGDTPTDPTEPAAEPPAGLRLAPDVRLPAAALPVDFKMSPVAEKALKNIVDDYYRDLAAALAPELEAATHGQDNGGDGGLIETGGNGEKTVVVTNGKIAEYARKRADARFKALFGNAAFNRMTMQSALESRLPAEGRN